MVEKFFSGDELRKLGLAVNTGGNNGLRAPCPDVRRLGGRSGFGPLGRIMSASAASAPSLASPPVGNPHPVSHLGYGFVIGYRYGGVRKQRHVPTPAAGCCFAGQIALPLFGADSFATGQKMQAIAAT